MDAMNVYLAVRLAVAREGLSTQEAEASSLGLRCQKR